MAPITAVLLISLAWLLVPAQSAGAASWATIDGSGSSWAGPAIDQWSQDIRKQGIVINYNPIGSAQGRSQYTTGQTDFAGSDIAFLNGQDKVNNGAVEYSQYSYSYLPITAGGTAFMYHLTVGGKQVTNLRLSGETIAKIFTGQIKNWSDPAITKDYGARLPSQPITPIIRSDASGATFQFTAWMNHQYPSLWNSFCAKYANVHAASCGPTESYPSFPSAHAQNGSTFVANYITSSYGDGAIGYDEYAYALAAHYPVVKVLNAAGYYVAPTATNVSVALTAAKIDWNPASKTYLMQDLTNVYGFKDRRSYPISSYSYLIVPSKYSTDGKKLSAGNVNPSFDDDKGRTLTHWADYFLCGGQSEAPALGYAPLPRPLIVGGITQVNRVPGHEQSPSTTTLKGCHNPTIFDGQDSILKDAPYPSACDKKGSPLYGCNAGSGGGGTGYDPNGNKVGAGGSGNSGGSSGGNNGNSAASQNSDNTPTQNSGGTGGGGSGTDSPSTGNGSGSGPGQNNPGDTGGSGGNATGNTPTGNGGGNTPSVGGNAPTTNHKQVRDPTTGKILDAAQTSAGESSDTAPPQSVALESTPSSKWLLGSLTAVEILVAILIPPILGAWLRRRRAGS